MRSRQINDLDEKSSLHFRLRERVQALRARIEGSGFREAHAFGQDDAEAVEEGGLGGVGLGDATQSDLAVRRGRQSCVVAQQTHRNQQIISERDPQTRRKSLDALRRIAADRNAAREYLLSSSMIASMRRAAEIL